MDQLNDDSKREKFLLMLFPAALVLAIYSVLFAVPMQRKKTTVETEYLTLQQSAVSKEAAANSKQNLENEIESLTRLRNRVALSRQQIRALCSGWRSRNSRLETLEKITELMQDSNLSIVSQGGDESVVISSYLKDLFQIMDEQTAVEPVEFWPVEIKGAYFDLVDFLVHVEEDAKTIIPVGITMTPDPEGSSQKTWTIVFVI